MKADPTDAEVPIEAVGSGFSRTIRYN
jgi:hypothetical protein